MENEYQFINEENKKYPQLIRKITIKNQYGIHVRPASLFTKEAIRFESDIIVQKEDTQINGKSIMGLMTIGATKGTKIILIAQGPDAEELLDKIEELINNNFNE